MKFLLILAACYFSLGLILFIFQERLIFFPDKQSCPELKQISVGQYQLRYLEKRVPDAKATLIHFHGNANGACDRKFVFDELGDLPIDIILTEYPGYSGDEEGPSLKKIKENALAFVSHFKEGPTFLFGESLGSAVAMNVAAKIPLDGLILQSPFSSLGEVGQSAYPVFPVKWLIRGDFNVEKVSTPSLVLIAEEDEIVPAKLSRNVTRYFEKVKVVEFENRNHNDLAFGNEKLWTEVAKFIRERTE